MFSSFILTVFANVQANAFLYYFTGAYVGAIPGPGGFHMLAKHILGDVISAKVRGLQINILRSVL